MAIRNDHDDYGWAMAGRRHAATEPKGRHNYYSPGPDFKDTVTELLLTLVGIVGVIILVIACVKAIG